ncbi:major facilitator superfamily domain-containing protein [Dichotomocladium elegans]|nr:major facilitator superfamily domain-containing protein [Dichotomocladium elegans]
MCENKKRVTCAFYFQKVICAFGQPFLLNSATPYAALWFSPDGRGSATTISGLTNAVGLAVASLVIPLLVTNPDEMWIGLLFQAVFTTATAIPSFFIPRKPKTPPSYSADTTDHRRMPFGQSLRLLFTNYNFVIVWFAFGVLCGLFSSITSLMPQILTPYGISVDDASYATVAFIIAGIAGAVVSGLVVDKFGIFKSMLKICTPLVGFMYLAMLFVVKENNYAPIVVICALMGFFSFALLPVGLELSVESSYPISESISSPLLWLCSQVVGLITLIGMDALRDNHGDPPGNMHRSLILATCISMPIMLLTTVYNSPNKRLENEATGRSVASQ